ncbi:putative membrane protein [Aminobacter aminovorans]|uniref:Immunity protein sdpI n=1 Tax=Aminobacter aminovorans TaxID=83263 RepID=A0A380WRE7_AMIAI|nr:SdpI family protein [Aminobacter aminovorans]TCS20425.1 putative membrane protein [Aminobacter aminovorans]SUU91480.1 Immunity protein sdpI [Aminobacter aminovorans]
MKQALFSRINLALAAALAAVTLAGYLLVPAGSMLPIHWGPSGEADSFWPRNTALLLAPVAVIVLSALLAFIGNRAGPEQMASSKHAFGTVIPVITGLMLAIQSSIVLIGLGYPDQMVRVITLSLGVMLLLLGNVMPKTQPNAIAGVRLPWIMNDPALWRATQRLTGMLFVAGGILLVVCASLVQHPAWLIVALLAAFLVPLTVGSFYSFLIARRSH